MKSGCRHKGFYNNGVCGLVIFYVCLQPIVSSAAINVAINGPVLQHYDIGPIRNSATADQLRYFFIARDIDYKEIPESVTKSLGYIVLTPVWSGSEQALLQLTAMKAEGFEDLVLIGRNVYKDRISAGVFSSRANAERRKQEMVSAGFSCEILERFGDIKASKFQIVLNDQQEPLLTDLYRLVDEEPLIFPGTLPKPDVSDSGPILDDLPELGSTNGQGIENKTNIDQIEPEQHKKTNGTNSGRKEFVSGRDGISVVESESKTVDSKTEPVVENSRSAVVSFLAVLIVLMSLVIVALLIRMRFRSSVYHLEEKEVERLVLLEDSSASAVSAVIAEMPQLQSSAELLQILESQASEEVQLWDALQDKRIREEQLALSTLAERQVGPSLDLVAKIDGVLLQECQKQHQRVRKVRLHKIQARKLAEQEARQEAAEKTRQKSAQKNARKRKQAANQKATKLARRSLARQKLAELQAVAEAELIHSEPDEVHQTDVPVEANPVEANPVEANPVEASPVEANPVEANPVEPSPVEPSPVEPNEQVDQFLAHLGEHLEIIDSAFAEHKYTELQGACRWIRRYAGVLGFSELADLAREIQELELSDADSVVHAKILRLDALVASLLASVPDDASGKIQDDEHPMPETIQSRLDLHNPNMAARVRQFARRLTSVIDVLQAAADSGELAQVGTICYGLVGKANSAGFADIVQVVERLRAVLDKGDSTLISRRLQDVMDACSRVEAPSEVSRNLAELKSNLQSGDVERAGASSIDIARQSGLTSVGNLDSSLDAENPALSVIVQRFLERLPGRLDEISAAEQNQQWSMLHKICYKLMGEAGSAGFSVFNKPVKSIEHLIESHQFDQVSAAIQELNNLHKKVSDLLIGE